MAANKAALEKNQADSSRHGGARKGAGRKAGSATKRTREIADKAAEDGVTPLEFMLDIMRNEPPPGLEPREELQANMLRFEAAKAAAPYIHPRLAAVEHSGSLAISPADMTDDQLAAIAATGGR